MCLQFILECLSVRLATRLRFDAANGYAIEPAVTALMTRFIADPYRVWLDETHAFYNLPNELMRMHATVVTATLDGSTQRRREANEYRLHAESVGKMVQSLRACERA